MERETDQVLRAAAGDHQAFDALAEACRPWLFGLCFRLLRDREDAQDTVQDALVATFRALPQLRQPERFRPWLGRIALNACRMRLRRTSSVPSIEIAGESALPPEPDSRPALTEMDDALAHTDPAARRMLRLFYGEGLTHAEVAEVLALSPAAVKSRLHRAREWLRKEMLKMMSPEQKARLGVTDEAPWALRTVLLVEPDESVRDSLRDALTAAGCEVIVLPTGEAALAAAAEHRGQMLILDKHCGEPNWVEVLTLLQVDAWTRDNLPIGVLIDPDSQRDLLLAWQAGAVLCLTRPPSADEVVRYVNRIEKAWPKGWRGGDEPAQPSTA